MAAKAGRKSMVADVDKNKESILLYDDDGEILIATLTQPERFVLVNRLKNLSFEEIAALAMESEAAVRATYKSVITKLRLEDLL